MRVADGWCTFGLPCPPRGRRVGAEPPTAQWTTGSPDSAAGHGGYAAMYGRKVRAYAYSSAGSALSCISIVVRHLHFVSVFRSTIETAPAGCETNDASHHREQEQEDNIPLLSTLDPLGRR